MIAGVRRNKLHVFPDKYARMIYYLLRFAPWLSPILDRRLNAKAIEVAKSASQANPDD